jgi:hypothetical protein
MTKGQTVFEAIVTTREFTFTKTYPTHAQAMKWVRVMMFGRPGRSWTIQEIGE